MLSRCFTAAIAVAAAVQLTSSLAEGQPVTCPPLEEIAGGFRMTYPNGTKAEVIFPEADRNGVLRLQTRDQNTGHTHYAERQIDPIISPVGRELTAGQIDLGRVDGELVVSGTSTTDTVGWLNTTPAPSFGFISRYPEGDSRGFFFYFDGQAGISNCIDDSLAALQFDPTDSPYGIIQCGFDLKGGIASCDSREIRNQLNQCTTVLAARQEVIIELRQELRRADRARERLELENRRLRRQLEGQRSSADTLRVDVRRAIRRLNWVIRRKATLEQTNQPAWRSFIRTIQRLNKRLEQQ